MFTILLDKENLMIQNEIGLSMKGSYPDLLVNRIREVKKIHIENLNSVQLNWSIYFVLKRRIQK